MDDFQFPNGWKAPIRGVIHVTGEPDTGKTTFALTVPGVLPQDIVFFDDDVKSSGMAKEMKEAGVPFGYYVNVKERVWKMNDMKPAEFFKFWLNTLMEEAKRAVPHPKVVIYDGWSPRMEDAIRAYFMQEKLSSVTEISPGQAKAMSMVTWTPGYEFYSSVVDMLSNYAPMVFLITHVKEKYVGTTKTGQLEARGQRPLMERPVFRVWTRANGDPKDGGAPIGLVLKRISRTEVTTDSIKVINVLPRKVKPLTWNKIMQYIHDPVKDRPLRIDEIPNPFEESILSGELTEDQKDSLHMARIASENENSIINGTEDTPVDPLKAQVMEYKLAGYAPPDIASALKISMPDVLKLMG